MAIDSTLTEDQLTSFLVGESFVQQENQTRNMSIKSFYFFTLVGMAILYGFMWGSETPKTSKQISHPKGFAFRSSLETDCWFFSKYPCWIHDIFLRSFSDSKCFSFYLSSRLRKPLAVVIRPIRFGCIECIIIRNLVGNLFPNMGLAQKEGLGVAVTMAMSFLLV